MSAAEVTASFDGERIRVATTGDFEFPWTSPRYADAANARIELAVQDDDVVRVMLTADEAEQIAANLLAAAAELRAASTSAAEPQP